ncbi:hypothetical protein Tco_0464908 [Tanacetum coccineum]
MQMMYCFINNIHVDYAKPLWEGLYYSLHYPTSSIPYPRFTKIIISHYMTKFHKISRRRYKDGVGMNIPAWMISEEMKHMEHYRMKASASALKRSNVIRLRIPQRRSTRLTPPAPVPNVDNADEIILQDTFQVSLAEHKSRDRASRLEKM